MKGKFRKILGVGLALALVLGFSLVTAVPVAADVSEPTVTVNPNTKLVEGAEYTIGFSVTSALAAGSDDITITFTGYTTTPGNSNGFVSDTEADWLTGDITVNGAKVFGTGAVEDAIDVSSHPAVTITVPEDINAGDSVEVIFTASAGISNPDAGSYTLTVATSGTGDGSPKQSASYIISGYLGGRVRVYTSTGVFVDSHNKISEGLSTATANCTVEVDPGTYTPSSKLDIDKAGVTLKGANYGVNPVTETRGAESIIDLSGISHDYAIEVGAEDVTIEGFTIDGSPKTAILFQYTADTATIRNNIITDTTDIAISFSPESSSDAVTDATISGNLIEDCGVGIMLQLDASDNTISNNTITGSTWTNDGAISIDNNNDNNTFTGNTLTDNLGSGIKFFGCTDSGNSDNNLIEGNTISGNSKHGIWVLQTNGTVTNLVITGNDITDNTSVGVLVNKWTADNCVINFNNITGNDTTNGYGLENSASEAAVDADHNWWGTSVASEIAGMITGSGTTNYDPWLGASLSVADYTASASSLNTQSTVGVKVTSSQTDTEIGVARYTGNPQEAPEFTAIEDGYFDVYATAAPSWDAGDMVAIKLYSDSVTSTSKAYFYSEFYGGWQECYEQIAVTGSYVWVKVRLYDIDHLEAVPTLSDLAGTPFAISGVAAEEDPWVYDVNNDDVIQKSEAIDAVWDYFDGVISKELAIDVVWLYFG